MRYATFINFTDKPFVGYWNGRKYTFQPGEKSEHLNELIAQHFAKHLTNQVLIDTRTPENENERYVSPKKPNEVPKFMDIFNQAFMLEGDGAEVDKETGLPVDNQPDEPSMNIKVAPRAPINADPYDAHAQPVTGPGDEPQVIGEINAEDEESSFEGSDDDSKE